MFSLIRAVWIPIVPYFRKLWISKEAKRNKIASRVVFPEALRPVQDTQILFLAESPPIIFRNEDQLNAQFFTNLLHFILYISSNMFRRGAILREEYITLLYKTLKTLKCAVRATVQIFLKCLNTLTFLQYFCILAWFVGAMTLVWRFVAFLWTQLCWPCVCVFLCLGIR
jgi:hypothetical protein